MLKCEREKKRKGGVEMKGKDNIPMCPKCRSKDTRARLKAEELWCRRCGYIGRREEFFEYVKDIKDVKK